MPAPITIDLAAFFNSLNLNLSAIKAEVEALTSTTWAPDPSQPMGPPSVTTTNGPDFVNGDAGDNVLVGTSPTFNIISAQGGNDVLIGNAGIDLLFGGTGIDTADYSYLNSGSTGAFVDLANNLAIAGSSDVDILSSIENVIGTKNADILLGNALNNVFNGNGGNDLIDGRGGIDVVQFLGKAEDYTFQALSQSFAGGFAVTGPNGPSGSVNTTVIIGVELVQFKDVSAGGAVSLFNIESSAIAHDDTFNLNEGDEGTSFGNLNVLSNDQILEMAVNNVLSGLIVGSTLDGNGNIVGGTVVNDPSDGNYPVPGNYGTLTVDVAAGTVAYTMNAAADALAAGQNATDTFYYEVVGGDRAKITINITGTNDDPVITSSAQAASIDEIADNAAGENSDTHSASGAVTFSDVDTIDTHSASFVPQDSGYRGTFTLDPVDQGGDSVGWSFDVADADLDDLAQGQTLTQIYEVTVDDGKGGTATQTVTVTITGTNDAPVITSSAQAASIDEIDDNAAGENSDTHSASGAVTFSDVDTIDTHSASFVPQDSGYRGTFTLDPVDQGGDSVGWSFDVADADLDDLAQGQALTQSYEVTVDDGNGGTATQTVTVTINGTNDAPVITSTAQAASIDEIADNAAGENSDTHSASGAVTFSDVDTIDTHSASFVPQDSGYRGTFTLDPVDQGGDSVGWSFDVADADLDDLAQGQALTQSYEVTVDDGKGGTATQTVTVTINGTNDAPVITSTAQAASIDEIADNAAGENSDTHSASGAVTFSDVDTIDTHSASFVPQDSGYRGTFTLDPVDQGGNSVGWSFDVADADLDDLAQGQTLTQIYEVTVDDGKGGTATQTVTVTITGTNDAPVITSSAQAASIDEIDDNAAGENSDTHSASGAVTFSDVDTIDTHSASFVPQDSGYRGTFTLDPVDQGGDSVGWSFDVADADLDDLAQGQALTQSYEVTVDDGNGGTATQTVTVTINGTNDAPVITSSAQAASIDEIADNAAGENSDTHSASGAVTFSDVDTIDTHSASFVPQDSGYRGTFTLDPVDQGGDSVGWSFDVADADLDDLAQGQALTQSYEVTVDDGNGGTATQTVTVTINGTNDAPVITSTAQAASIDEIADNAAGENSDTHSASGAVTFSDVDTIDTHSASFVPQDSGYRGTFTLDPVDQGGDSVGWSFDVADADLDDLAQGQTLTQIYEVTVDDGKGGTATQTVTVTITGTNDAPVITSSAQAASIDEIDDNAAGENSDTHSASGAVTFSDVDTIDTHSASFVPQDSGYRGTFTLDPVDQGGDSVGWSFDVADADLDDLAQGQALTQSYEVTVDDGNGGTATQTVTVTINGTNDAPVITSTAQAASIDEIADNAAGENSDTHSASGAVTFSDVDTIDTHSASFVPQDSGYRGTFTLDPVDQGGDSVGWSFDVADADLDDLAQGQALTQSYEVTVDDGKGGTATQTVTVTITGTNDAPVITSTAQAASIDEIADNAAGENSDTHSASGAVTFSDVDTIDTHSASFVPQDSGYRGTFTLDPVDQGGNSVGWSFDVADADLDDLAQGQTLTQIYEVTVDDGKGGTATQTVTVTITGTNDAPVITSSAQAASIDEIDDNAAGENSDTHSASGAVTFSDVDTIDTHSASFVPQDSGYRGTFTLDPVDQGGDSVGWSFDVADADLDDLAQGQALTQSYEVTVDDGNGGTATQTVTVTINGTNDAPVITSDASDAQGAVTEAGSDADGNVVDPGVPTAIGTLTSSDVDNGATATWSGNAAGTYGDFAIDALTGAWTYTLNNASAATQALAAGETQTETFTATVTDDKGATATQVVTVTINGTNDAPVVISPQTVPAQVTEITDEATGETSAMLSTGGSITVKDVDSDFLDGSGTFAGVTVGASPSFTYDPAIPGQDLPASVLNAVLLKIESVTSEPGSHTAKIIYEFEVSDGAIEFLGEGDTLTIEYTVEINDGDGGSVQTPVTIVVNGKNDAPEITTSPIEMSWLEVPNATGPQDISVTGSFTVNDIDIGDTLTASVSGGNAVYSGGAVPAGLASQLLDAGNFTFSPSTTNGGDVDVNFNAAGVDLDFLAVNETLEITFDVKVNDGLADSNLVPVTITITGTNDAPTVSDVMVGDPSNVDASATTADASGNVYEDCGLNGNHPNIATGDALTTGTGGNASDPDNGDDAGLHITNVANAAKATNSAVPSNSSTTIFGVYGALMIAADGIYEYKLYNTADPEGDLLNELRHDQVVSETFEFTVSDGNGGQDTANLVFTVVGTNDKPEVGDVTGSVKEDTDVSGGMLTTDGSITIGDVDNGDTHTVEVVPNSNIGVLSAQVNPGSSEVDWVYTVDNNHPDVQQLGVGQSKVETFQIEVSDGVETTTSSVTITINGTNDKPTINALSDTLTESEIAGGHTINVLVEGNADDIDQGDTVELEGLSGSLELLLNSAGGVDIDIDVQSLIDSGLVSFSANGEVTVSEDFTDAISQMMQSGDVLTVEAEVTIKDSSMAANDTATGEIDLTVHGEDGQNASPAGSNYGVGNDGNGDPFDVPDFLIPTFDENGNDVT